MTPHVLKIWNIDGADNYTKIDTMDIITNYLLLYFSKEFSSIRKIHVDGSNICAIHKGWKKFQRLEHWRNCLVARDFKSSSSSSESNKYILFFKVKCSHNGYMHPIIRVYYYLNS